MKQGKSAPTAPAKKRVTVSLPTEYLERAERIARAEHLTLSNVVTRALANSLAQMEAPKRAEGFLASYRKAFEIPGVSEDDLSLLEGIVLEPIGPDNPDPAEDQR